MIAIMVALALIWGLPLIFVLVIGAATFVSSSVERQVRDLLFG